MPLQHEHSAVDLTPSAVEYAEISSSRPDTALDADAVGASLLAFGGDETFPHRLKKPRRRCACRVKHLVTALSAVAFVGVLLLVLFRRVYQNKYTANASGSAQAHSSGSSKPLTLYDWLSGRFRPETTTYSWAHSPDGSSRSADSIYVVRNYSILVGPASELPSYDKFITLVNLDEAKQSRHSSHRRRSKHSKKHKKSRENDDDHYYGNSRRDADEDLPPRKMYSQLLKNFFVSKDELFVLFATEKESSWRQKSNAVHYVYDVHRKSFSSLAGGKPIFFAEWSAVGHVLAYVDLNNGLWIAKHDKAKSTWTEVALAVDASDAIRYGRADWVYEEDMFENPRALYWSPDASHIAFLRFDDTEVPVYELLSYFGKPNAHRINSYPTSQSLRYPKPESKNPVVTLHVVNINDLMKSSHSHASTGQTHEKRKFDKNPETPQVVKFSGSELNLLGPVENWIYSGVSWVSSSLLVVRNLNRVQNVAVWSWINVSSVENSSDFVGRPFYVESHDSGAWVRPVSPVIPLPSISQSAFATIMENEGFMHVALMDPASSSPKHSPRFLTSSKKWEVDKIFGFDVESNSIIISASEENSPGSRVILAVKLEKTGREPHSSQANRDQGSPTAKVRKLFPEVPENSLYDASFNQVYRAALLSYNGPDVPWEKLFYIPPNAEEPAKLLKNVTQNEDLRKNIISSKYPNVEYRFITLDNGVTVYAKFMLPPPLTSITEYDESFRLRPVKRYPVHIYVYAGPESQENTKEAKTNFCTVLTSSLDVICASFDVRGAAFRGLDYRHAVYKQLGTKEVEDHIAAIKWLGERRVVDSDKIGIFGWSFGGYMVCRIIEKIGSKEDKGGPKLAYAVAVAPVTDWRLYDSFYTERYMGSVEGSGNENYYKSAVSNGEAFRNIPTLIMQGSHDDNVHVGNMYWLLTLLERSGITSFRFRMYPDSDHSMNFEDRFVDVYSTASEFIHESLESKSKHF